MLWATLAFWAFSLGSGFAFFRFDLASRLPLFLVAFTGALMLPISACCQLRRVRRGASRLGAWLRHLAAAVLCLLALVGTARLLALAPEPLHLSGEDATGVVVHVLWLGAAATLTALALGAMLLWQRRQRT